VKSRNDPGRRSRRHATCIDAQARIQSRVSRKPVVPGCRCSTPSSTSPCCCHRCSRAPTTIHSTTGRRSGWASGG